MADTASYIKKICAVLSCKITHLFMHPRYPLVRRRSAMVNDHANFSVQVFNAKLFYSVNNNRGCSVLPKSKIYFTDGKIPCRKIFFGMRAKYFFSDCFSHLYLV